MTDKEIKGFLGQARWNAVLCESFIITHQPEMARAYAVLSVRAIHHIINSINWED